MNKSDPQFVPSPIYVTCEVFRCRNRAKFRIGRPDGPIPVTMNVCEECAKKISLSGLELFPDLFKVDEAENRPEVPEKVEPEKIEQKKESKKTPKKEADDLFGDIEPFE